MKQTDITKTALVDAGFDDETEQLTVTALCLFLDCEPSDLSPAKHDHYGLSVYRYGQQEYAVGTDSEATDAAKKNIEDSLWAFNASFILEQCELPFEMEDAIKAMQEKECESCNDTIRAMVNKCTTFNEFAAAAINADGRGHFMSSYDGEENEETVSQVTFYIYRTN